MIRLQDVKIKTDKEPKKIKHFWTKLTLVLLSLLGVVLLVLRAIDWGASHQVLVQRPWIFETRPLVVISKIEPEILSPVVMLSEDFEGLDDVEQKILYAFGERNFAVMRAVAKCESNMNPEAVNWETRDIGLFQINWPTWEKVVKEEFGYTLSDMFDVDKNIEVAQYILDRNGDGEGDINPWVATSTQCFRNEL